MIKAPINTLKKEKYMKLIRFFQFILLSNIAWFSPALTTEIDSHEIPKACHSRLFRSFGESVTLDITMTIPQLSGIVPMGANVNVTPFAIAPNGRVSKGLATNIVPSSGLITPLNSIVIPNPLIGNYVIGYYITLGAGSPTFPGNTLANFSGVLLNNPIGSNNQTITFPVQTLFLAPIADPEDVLTVTANFPIINF